MTGRVLCGIVGCIIVGAFANSTFADEADAAIKAEQKKMQGTWELQKLRDAQNVEKTAADIGVRVITIIKDDTFEVKLDKEVVGKGTFKIIEVKGKQRKADLSYEAPDAMKGKVGKQLAEWLDNDTFRVAFVYENITTDLDKRPTDLDAAGQAVAVFKRVKE